MENQHFWFWAVLRISWRDLGWLWPSSRRLECVLGRLVGGMGRLVVVMGRPGTSWERLGPSWGCPGLSWGRLGCLLGRLWATLVPHRWFKKGYKTNEKSTFCADTRSLKVLEFHC